MSDIGVFPSLPGLAWNVSKTPTFQTRVQRAVSGRELRALDYPYPLWQFSLVYEFLRDNPAAGYDELHTLMGFVMQCQGAFGTFLFDDPTDDEVTAQPLGTGDGTTQGFQLVRTLGGFVEPITAPNLLTSIYFDGVRQTPMPAHGLDGSTGILSFVTAPQSGTTIAADFSYYFRCRFTSDSYTFENFMSQLWALKKLDFISVRS